MKAQMNALKLAVAVLMAASLASLSWAAVESDSATAEKVKGASVGEPAPAWKDLTGVDDKKHALADHKDAKAVVVAFTCNHCPVAKAYEDRLIAIAEDYKNKGVDVVAINVNNMEADKLPAMKERAEEKGFKFDYLYDPSQEIGREFGATVTPHVFLLDDQRNVAYVGAIDDNMNADDVTTTYLRDAIDAVLMGSKPETDSTKPVGCGIKYE